MRTKNIFKTVALAMMMPAMLLTTACSNQDDVANTSNITNKGYALPVTVSATRGDGATRASFDGSKLNFSEGDKLFVKGIEEKYGGAGPFAGTLTYVPATGRFSGTIYSEGAFSGTAADLLGSAQTSVTATLLPAGYEGYGFLTVSGGGYSATLTTDATKAFATTKAAGVEQLSLEQASAYSSGFALAPQNAILNFTINDLAKNTEVTISYTDDKSKVISGNVTTDGNGTALFAIGVANSTALHNCNMTVGSNAIALTANFKTLVFGKIYNVTRSVAPAIGHALSSAVVGDIIGSDGNAYKGTDYHYLPVGVTAVAKVCYVGGGKHLALAMADEEGTMKYETAKSTCGGKEPKITGCTWKCPSDDEWVNMFNDVGGFATLRDGFSLVGGTNMHAGNYWTSTQMLTQQPQAYYRNFSNGNRIIGIISTGTYYVRACLSW